MWPTLKLALSSKFSLGSLSSNLKPPFRHNFNERMPVGGEKKFITRSLSY